MGTLWERLAPMLHATTDAIVGDTISYARAGGAAVEIQGYVIDEAARVGIESLDEPLGQRMRLKVPKAAVPDVSLRDRFAHPRLGAGTFKPGAAVTDPDSGGRYWLMDVEKA